MTFLIRHAYLVNNCPNCLFVVNISFLRLLDLPFVRHIHLEKIPVAAIELDLDRDVAATSNAGNIEVSDVDGYASWTFASGLEEVDSKGKLNAACRGVEDREVSRVLFDRDENASCSGPS